MEKAIEYRTIAAQLRREAASITLISPRQMKLRAAERWDELASEIEMVVAPSNGQTTNQWIF